MANLAILSIGTYSHPMGLGCFPPFSVAFADAVKRPTGFCVKDAQHRRSLLVLDAGSWLAQASICEGVRERMRGNLSPFS